MAQAGVIPFQAFPLFGDSGASLHKHTHSISWDCVLVCKRDVPVHLLELDDEATASGRSFAATWVKRLRTQGHNLSAGDVTNLAHAGTVLATFVASQAARGHERQAS
jgi:hypothetical protein